MKNYWKLINGKLVNIEEMKTGTLKNGYTVSGYNALPGDILSREGWKPLREEDVPEIIEGVTYEKYYEETEAEIIARYRMQTPEVVIDGEGEQG